MLADDAGLATRAFGVLSPWLLGAPLGPMGRGGEPGGAQGGKAAPAGFIRQAAGRAALLLVSVRMPSQSLLSTTTSMEELVHEAAHRLAWARAQLVGDQRANAAQRALEPVVAAVACGD